MRAYAEKRVLICFYFFYVCLFVSSSCFAVWESTRRRLYCWHQIAWSSRILLTNSRLHVILALCSTHHAGWVILYFVPLCFEVSCSVVFTLHLVRPPVSIIWQRISLLILTNSPFCLQVRNLERAYFKMWSLYSSGQHPEPFKVTENNSEFPYDR